jgi:serine/threonine-protein kinase
MRPDVLAPDSLVLDGRFRVLRPLGSGGMGEVYLGEQVSLGRKVAIKVLHHDLHLQPGMAERFKREARLLSAVEHPAVVRVIDFGESGDAACLVMELVEGESLHTALHQGPFPPPRALPLLQQLAEGLAAIHDKGIIHRDLKPENILLTRGPRGEQARLLDFGIARMAESDAASNLSQVGMVLGTPEYLSPEQAVGGTVDARSDLYSFGVMAYRVLSGRLPFDGPLPRQFLAQHAHVPPRSLLESAPALASHPTLVALVMRLLQKDPADRYPSALALADALAALTLATAAPSLPGTAAATSADLPVAGTVAFGPVEPLVPASARTAAFGTPVPTQLGTPVPAEPHAPEAPPPVAPSGTVVFGTVSPSAPPATDTAAFSLRPAGTVAPVASGSLALKSRNLAVMLTDIKGYTERTSRQTREENARMLGTHDALLLPLLREHNGRLVQKRGDALLAVFRSPTESVLCGMAMQDRLWRHNQGRPPEQQIHIRVCIHAGEVLESKDTLVGEPVEVVEAVEHVGAADDVTFTEAVNLARNRAEADAEPCGTIPLPGRAEQLQLYRCVRAAEGPPYGSRFEKKAGGLQRVKAALVPKARASLGKLTAWTRAHSRQVAGVGAALGLMLGGGAVLVVRGNNPVVQARALLADHKPQEALKRLQTVPAEEAKGDAAHQQVRARALHALGRHNEEHAVLAALADEALKDADSEVLDGLAEDFGEDEGDRSLRRVLGRLPKEALLEHFEDLADAAYSPRQWGALLYLDAEQRTDGLNLRKLYSAALESPHCGVRGKAARRLGALGDRDAVAALTKLAERPKEKGFLSAKNCGQDEAAAALQALKKKGD